MIYFLVQRRAKKFWDAGVGCVNINLSNKVSSKQPGNILFSWGGCFVKLIKAAFVFEGIMAKRNLPSNLSKYSLSLPMSYVSGELVYLSYSRYP